MFKTIIRREITELQSIILTTAKNVNDQKFQDTHKVCKSCNITGHTVDMEEVWDLKNGHCWFHNGCYAAEYNKHLCPCKCGKWIDNKKKK